MEIKIKIVGTEDAALLANVAEDVFDHDIAEDRLRNFLSQPNHILCIAIAESLVVGQARAAILHHPDKAPELFVDNVGVSPAFQRRGIASQLLNTLMQLGRTHDCTEIWVSAEPDNQPARALYNAHGLTHQNASIFDGKL